MHVLQASRRHALLWGGILMLAAGSAVCPHAALAATLFSDSFSGSTIDSSSWNVFDTAGTNITQNNGLFVKGSYLSAGNHWDQTSITSKQSFASSSLSISVKVTKGSGGSGDTLIGYGDPNFQDSGAQAYIIDLSGSTYGLLWNGGGTTGSKLSGCGSYTAGATYTLTVTSSGFNIYMNTGSGDVLQCSVPASFVPAHGTIFFESDTSSVGTKFENLVVTGTLSAASAPDAPTGLTATAGNMKMNLAWTAPADGGASISDYLIEYKLHTDASWTTFSDGVSTATSTTVTGLTNSSSYDFRVSAINSVGTSTPSSTATATPAPSAPGAPTALAATATSSAVALTWTAPADNGGSSIFDYVVQYKLSTDSSWTTFTDGSSTVASTTVTGLTNGLAYTFQVAAANSIGTGSYSSSVSATPSSVVGGSGVLLSDSFTGTSIDTGKWIVFDTAGTNITQNDALFVKNSYAGSNWDQTSVTSVDSFPGTNLSVSAKLTLGTGATGATILGYGDPDFGATGHTAYILDLIGGSSVYALAWSNGSYVANSSCGTYTAGATYKIAVTGTGFSAYKNTGSGDVLLCNFTSGLALTNKQVFLESDSSSVGGKFDDVLVSNIVVNAPDAPTGLVTTVGNGQMGLAWTIPASDGGSSITDYTVEYKLHTDSSWTTFSDGVSTGTSTTVTGLTNGVAYDFRVSAVNAEGTGTASATATATPDSVNAALAITFPLRSEAASSTTATLTIHDEDSHDFTIPYIQTSTTFAPTASVGTSLVPSGGGVKFVLNQGLAGEVSQTDTSAPYAAAFSNLAKGEYTLDVYVVDSAGVVQAGSNYHDSAIHIGIGDIIAAVGDSITECYYGLRTTTDVTSWLNAPSNMISSDNRNFPQYGPTTASNLGQANWCAAWEVQLSEELESYYNYPVFIMNEGVGGIRADNTVTRMATSQWSDREAALEPNKMLLHLGTNDGIAGITTANFQTSMQSIISTFLTTYGVSASDIWLAYPSYSATYTNTANYLPNITALISGNALSIGPDFWDFYSHNTSTYYSSDPVHPNTVGETQMARLWAYSMMTPKAVSAAQVGNAIALSWGDLSTVDSDIAGYRVRWGTSASSLSNTIDAGSATSATISAGSLSSGQTYYFGVQAYDSGFGMTTYTATSTPVSLAYATDTAPPAMSSITAGDVSHTGATISWTTTESADTQVEYGLTSAYTASTTKDSSFHTSHTAAIANLAACTTYHYAVLSADIVGNQGTSADKTFTTTGCTASVTVTAATTTPVTTASGDTITFAGTGAKTLSLSIPANFTSTSSSATFQAQQLDPTTFFASISVPAGQNKVGNYVASIKAYLDASTTLSSFDKPITVTLTYDPADLSGIDANSLSIYRYDDGTGWTALSNCTTDTTAHTVSCDTSNFSDFALFGSGSTSSSASTGTATYGAILAGYSTPNPLPGAVAVNAGSSVSSVASTASLPANDLEYGDTGADVLALQQYLNAYGYTVAASGPGSLGHETEYFGLATQRALARLQAALSITPAAGYYGPKTRAALAGTAKTPAAPAQTQSVSSLPATDLEYGDTNTGVLALQQYLNTHGYSISAAGAGSPGNETEYFGLATQNALSLFQKAHGITPAVGYYGAKTRAAMAGE